MDQRLSLQYLTKPENRERKILAFDPGETMGIALFHGSNLVGLAQASAARTGAGELLPSSLTTEARSWLEREKPDVVICEEYRVYRWRAKQHANSDLFTPRLIGGIELVCDDAKIPLIRQTAHVAKTFVTDSKLKAWSLYNHTTGKKHARDAVRHACYYLIFGAMGKQKVKVQNVARQEH